MSNFYSLYLVAALMLLSVLPPCKSFAFRLLFGLGYWDDVISLLILFHQSFL